MDKADEDKLIEQFCYSNGINPASGLTWLRAAILDSVSFDLFLKGLGVAVDE